MGKGTRRKSLSSSIWGSLANKHQMLVPTLLYATSPYAPNRVLFVVLYAAVIWTRPVWKHLLWHVAIMVREQRLYQSQSKLVKPAVVLRFHKLGPSVQQTPNRSKYSFNHMLTLTMQTRMLENNATLSQGDAHWIKNQYHGNCPSSDFTVTKDSIWYDIIIPTIT